MPEKQPAGRDLLERKLAPFPVITYGRKDHKSLSLTAKQFRSDVFTTMSDDDNDADKSETVSVTACLALQASRSRRESKSLVSSPNNDDTTIDSRSHQLKTEGSRALRRLPINELHLVSSPAQQDYCNYSLNDSVDVEAQDPILDRSSPPCKRLSSLADAGRMPLRTKGKVAVPLGTASRLKAATLGKKTFARPHESSVRPRQPGSDCIIDPMGNDGFEASEMTLDPTQRRSTFRRKQQRAVPSSFATLELRSGPLPDVSFEPATSELMLKTQDHGQVSAVAGAAHVDAKVEVRANSFSKAVRRRVSFSDPACTQLIRAQLSSISAPERLSSEPSETDQDSEADMQEYDDDDVVEVEDDEEFESQITDREHHSQKSEPMPSDHAGRHNAPSDIVDSNFGHMGLTSRSRQDRAVGTLPRQTPGKRRLIEVSDAILDDHEPQHHQDHYVSISEEFTARHHVGEHCSKDFGRMSQRCIHIRGEKC